MKRWQFKILVFAIVAAMGLVGYVTLFGNEGWFAYRRLSLAETQMRQEVFTLKQKNHQLVSEIYRLKHDPDYMERVIRRELNMGKPDELVFKFR